jgi:glycine betaine/proline transport system substrate-binding protein
MRVTAFSILCILFWPFSCIAACPVDKPINVAGLDYDSARFGSELVAAILRSGLGCKVNIAYDSLDKQIAAMRRGEAHLLMEVWLDNVNSELSAAQKEGSIVLLGTNFASADEGWFVPRYLVEGPNASVPSLRSVNDLRRYKDLFHGEFLNCPLGWNCNKINEKKLAAYGLAKFYQPVNALSDTDLVDRVTRAYQSGSAILFYAWHPDILLAKYDFAKLREPPFNSEVWAKLIGSDHPTAACEYPQSAVFIGARTQFINVNPQLKELLNRWRLSNEDIVDAIIEAHATKRPMKQIAENFIRLRPDVWAPWVPEGVAASLKAALGTEIPRE